MNYQDHYNRLAAIAQQLSRQEQVNVDQLLPMVDEALQSYHFCKDRLDAVERLLAEKLSAETTEPSAPNHNNHDTSAPF